MIVRKYEQLYANELDNLDEMNKFLETYNLPKPKQEESKYLSIPNTTNTINTQIRKLSENTIPEPSGFTGKFYQIFKEELTHNLLKLFQNIQEQDRPQAHL